MMPRRFHAAHDARPRVSRGPPGHARCGQRRLPRLWFSRFGEEPHRRGERKDLPGLLQALRGHDRPAEIHEAVHNLRHALQMHHGRWSPAEIVRVRDLLNNTAKAIVDGPVTSQEHAE